LIPAPDLSQSSRLSLERWDSTEHVTVACIAADVGQWSTDATEVAQGKLTELASGTLERMRGEPTPMHTTATAHGGRERTLQGDQAPQAHARTYLTFSDGQAHGCFVACDLPCAELEQAPLAMREPPPPGLALRSLGYAIHHPHGAGAMLGALLVALAALAIVTRPRKPFPH
jgi:hypothetical protein